MSLPSCDAIIAAVMPLIKQAEGFRAKPYLDVAGVPTIGYGTTFYPDGRHVDLKDHPVSEIEAEVFAEAALEKILSQLAPVFHSQPTVNQCGAMLSLAYNIGLSAFESSTLLKLFNAGDVQGAADQFAKWDKAKVSGGMTEVLGLLKRRLAEKALFETP